MTDIILNGEIERLADVNCFFELPKSDQAYTYVKTRKLQRGTLQEQQNATETTKKATLIQMKWGENSEYEYKDLATGKPLTYYLHPNTARAGVNILEIPLDGQNGDITFPCFVSSGRLTGCVYAWFLLDEKIVFLHAGAASGYSVENGSQEEKRCRRRADIFNGLRYCMGDITEPANECLTTEELLDMIQQEEKKEGKERIKAGQIIYPADQIEKEDRDKIQTMSYRPQNGSIVGECLCIITKSDEGVKVSGMMTEKEGNTYKNQQGRILKVDRLGNEIR